MARHYLKAAKPTPQKPRAEIKAAPTWYERTHPVGSAERFLDEAAKVALSAAANGGLMSPRQAVLGAAKTVAKEALRPKFPSSLMEDAAKLPAEELARRAARAAAYGQAAKAQNETARAVLALLSPGAEMARTQAAAAAAAMAADADARGTQQDAKGGDAPGGPGEPPMPPDKPAQGRPRQGGPRIVINPTTFANKKDALCVAFNEGFRLWMEAAGFEPQSEPTDAQRKFFSDTAYADDEVQLRRTILARIATFDTSVKDPTDDQLSETASFLNEILESDWCKNDWERDCVSRLANAVQAAVGAEPVEPRQEPLEPREPEPLQKRAAP